MAKRRFVIVLEQEESEEVFLYNVSDLVSLLEIDVISTSLVLISCEEVPWPTATSKNT